MNEKQILGGLQYLTQMGSHAYGTNTVDSDIDLYGWTIPPLEILFPSLNGGEIEGFDKGQRFEQLQTSFDIKGMKVDVHCYNIAKYFALTASGNPNMLDSLFTLMDNVIYISDIGQLVKDNRNLFLSRQAISKYWGYINSQWHKLQHPENRTGGRLKLIEAHGFDSKFASHIIRLLGQLRQIKRGNLSLQGGDYIGVARDVKAGKYDVGEVVNIITTEIGSVEREPIVDRLPEKADMTEIKNLLVRCLKEYFKDEWPW